MRRNNWMVVIAIVFGYVFFSAPAYGQFGPWLQFEGQDSPLLAQADTGEEAKEAAPPSEEAAPPATREEKARAALHAWLVREIWLVRLYRIAEAQSMLSDMHFTTFIERGDEESLRRHITRYEAKVKPVMPDLLLWAKVLLATGGDLASQWERDEATYERLIPQIDFSPESKGDEATIPTGVRLSEPILEYPDDLRRVPLEGKEECSFHNTVEYYRFSLQVRQDRQRERLDRVRDHLQMVKVYETLLRMLHRGVTDDILHKLIEDRRASLARHPELEEQYLLLFPPSREKDGSSSTEEQSGK